MARRCRPAVAAVFGASLLFLAVLGIRFHHAQGTVLDKRIADELYQRVGNRLGGLLLDASEPTITVSLSVAVVVIAAALRCRRVAAWAAIAPALAIVVTEVILKPLVHRTLNTPTMPLSFPSGHETGLATLTVELAFLAVRAQRSVAMRAVVVLVLAAWTVAGALGLVRNFYHYTTDTVGAVLVSLACVLGVALLVDRLAGPLDSSRRTASRDADVS